MGEQKIQIHYALFIEWCVTRIEIELKIVFSAWDQDYYNIPFERIKRHFYNLSIKIKFITMLQRLNPLKFAVAQAQESAQLEGLQCYL